MVELWNYIIVPNTLCSGFVSVLVLSSWLFFSLSFVLFCFYNYRYFVRGTVYILMPFFSWRHESYLEDIYVSGIWSHQCCKLLRYDVSFKWRMIIAVIYTTFCSCEKKAWKKIRLVRDSNPWPLRYRCIVVPIKAANKLTCQLLPVGLLHQYHRGQGFESRCNGYHTLFPNIDSLLI